MQTWTLLFFAIAITFFVLFLTKKSGTVDPPLQTYTVDASTYFETAWNEEIPAGTQKIVLTFANSTHISEIQYVYGGIDSIPSEYSFLDMQQMLDGVRQTGEITQFVNGQDPGANPQIQAESDTNPGSFNTSLEAVFILRKPLNVPRLYNFGVNN